MHWDIDTTHKWVESIDGTFKWNGKTYITPGITGRSKSRISKELSKIEDQDINPGYNLTCDINELIEKVCISPLAEDWFLEIVKNVSRTYGLEAPVTKSELIAEPLK